MTGLPQYSSMEPVGAYYSNTSRTSPLPSPHLDKRFFDCSLIEMKSQASSSSTLDYDSMDEVWVKRNDPTLTPETVRRKKVSGNFRRKKMVLCGQWEEVCSVKCQPGYEYRSKKEKMRHGLIGRGLFGVGYVLSGGRA